MSCDDFCGPDIRCYIGRDNAVTIVPYSDIAERVNYDMTAVTRVVADADPEGSTTSGDSFEGDSDTTQAVFWDQLGTDEDTGALIWRIYCKVGLFTGITAGEYTLRITIYDPDHPNGLVLPGSDTGILVTVVAAP